jgi:hypothetical protein
MSSIDDARSRITRFLSLRQGRHAAMSREEHPPMVRPMPVKPIRARRPIVLMRLHDADCPSCRGFGCTVCAGTGLG